MGSLNGTILNSQALHRPQSGSRHWSNPVELSSGDTVTLGTTSKILVCRCKFVENLVHMVSHFAAQSLSVHILILQLLCECLFFLPFIFPADPYYISDRV